LQEGPSLSSPIGSKEISCKPAIIFYLPPELVRVTREILILTPPSTENCMGCNCHLQNTLNCKRQLVYERPSGLTMLSSGDSYEMRIIAKTHHSYLVWLAQHNILIMLLNPWEINFYCIFKICITKYLYVRGLKMILRFIKIGKSVLYLQ
jgi:hypothetical protein